MTTLPRVLVTGATGKTGGATVSALTSLHSDVVQTRVLVRKDDHRAQALRDSGAEVITGDMSDLRDMRRAMRGVQRAYFVAPINARSLDFGVNFAIAAAEANVEHVVAMSQWLASPGHPSNLTRRAWLIDQLVTWIPGADHTVINVGFFADNFMLALGLTAQFGTLRLPLGKGATAPISNEDIGRVVAGVLSDPVPYAGRTLRPTGPEVLTPQDIARVFGEVLGRKIEYRNAPERMALKSLRASGRTSFEMAQIVHYLREYRLGTFESGGVTDVVQEVTGRPAEDFATIARRYADSEPLVKRSFGNKIRALGRVVKVVLTPPLDLDRWAREVGLPTISGEYCADTPEWNRTHDVPNAFGVAETARHLSDLA